MYAKEGFIRRSHAMHELSSNNPDLARQVFCILSGDGTLSCRRFATWVVLFFHENRTQGSHLFPLKQAAIYCTCTHCGGGHPSSQACISPEINVSVCTPVNKRGAMGLFSCALTPPGWLCRLLQSPISLRLVSIEVPCAPECPGLR